MESAPLETIHYSVSAPMFAIKMSLTMTPQTVRVHKKRSAQVTFDCEHVV